MQPVLPSASAEPSSPDSSSSMQGRPLRADGQAVLWPTVLRMRDIAVVGQIGVMGMALWLQIGFPVWAVASVIGVTLVSNIALRIAVIWWPVTAQRCLPATVLFDLVAFSILMFLTGGARNPLCAIYMVHVAIGVVLLPLPWAAAVTVLTASAYGLMFRWSREISVPAAVEHSLSFEAAEWMALAVAAVLIAYFIWLVKSALLERDRRLSKLRQVEVDNARLASLTTLAAGAAHELGSPLGTIAIVSKEIERAATSDEMLEDAQLIRSEVDRCREILDRLRSEEMVAWLTQEPEWIEPGELVEHLKVSLGPAAGRLQTSVEPGTTRLRVMSQALVQVLIILVRNAIDASPPDAQVKLTISATGTLTQLTVTDTGEGIPEDKLKRVFEAFYTTKPAGRGMGLGLFLARLMVDGMGGNLSIRSEVGRGTEAVVWINHDHSHRPADR